MINTRFPQFSNFIITVALYEDVTNLEELRANADSNLPFALINASLIYSKEQLYSAIYRVLVEYSYNKMLTASFSTECLLRLSASTKVSDSLKFGLKYPSSVIICINIEAKDDHTRDYPDKSIFDLVKGKEIDFNDENLLKFCDVEFVRKLYKIDPSFKPKQPEEFSRALVNAIQLRGL